MMWITPVGSGLDSVLPDLQKLPLGQVFFQSLAWPGFFLLVVNGLTQFVAAWSVISRRRWCGAAVLGCGLILAGWLTIQWVVFAPNPVTTIYTVFALVQIGLGLGLVRSPFPPD